MVATGRDNELLVADGEALWRHDGLNWDHIRPYPARPITLLDILQPIDGSLLINRGHELLAILDHSANFTIDLSPSGISGSTCKPVLLPDGRVITADSKNLLIVGSTGVKRDLPTPEGTKNTFAIGADSQGQLWCATNLGIFRLVDQSWRLVTITGAPREHANDIAMILTVEGGLVFLPRVFASRHSGLQWDGELLTPLPRAQAQGQLSDALITPNGHMLVAFQYSGLLSLCWDDEKRCRWQAVNIPQPFEAAIKSMALMTDGRLAVVTHLGKLLLNDSLSQRWETHDPTTVGISSVINSLAHAEKGGVWVGTHEGVARFDGKSFVDVYLEAGELGMPLEQITAVHEDNEGQLWVGSGSGFHGLLRFDGEQWHREHLDSVRGYGVHSMHTDANGELWLTMLSLSSDRIDFRTGAILHRSGGEWIVHDRVGDKPMPRIYSLTWQPDGSLLAGGLEDILRFDGEHWTEWMPSPLGAERSAFALMARSNGDIWLGGGRADPGVSWLPSNSQEWNHPSTPLREDGTPLTPSELLLQRAAAASFAETGGDHLWFASETGLYHVILDQCHQVIPQGAARDHSFWPLLASYDKKSLWIGSLGGGLLRLRADDTAPPTTNPPQVQVPDPDHTRNVVLSWSGNDTWSVTPPELLLFSHSLDGAEFSLWSSATSSPFFDAAPGPHTLTVKAMDSAANFQRTPTTLTFDVEPGPPPLWARTEMQVAYVVALLALGGLAFVIVRRQRERLRDAEARNTLNERLRELTRRLMTTQEDERRSLARDLHDDLGQLLTVTTMQIELAAGLDDPERRSSALELAAQSSRRAINSVRNLATQIRPTLLDDLGLETAVNATLDDFAAATRVVLERDVLFEHHEISDNVASHVFRIIMESLTNVVRHAHADTISLRLEVTAHTIDILVQDDGDGFDPERSTSDHGIGLLGMRERAEALGGAFTIDSQPGRGTSLHVSIPLLATPTDGNHPPW
ncbi:MAG: signal transduction histidine kinase [Pseudohongiellaceae bacterium]|jgi:signal transduction histidine kinase